MLAQDILLQVLSQGSEIFYKTPLLAGSCSFCRKYFFDKMNTAAAGFMPQGTLSCRFAAIHLVRSAQGGSSLQPIATLLGKPCIGAVCQITDLDSTAKVGARRPPFQGLPRSKHASVLNRVHYSPANWQNKLHLYWQTALRL